MYVGNIIHTHFDVSRRVLYTHLIFLTRFCFHQSLRVKPKLYSSNVNKFFIYVSLASSFSFLYKIQITAVINFAINMVTAF